MKQTLGHLYFVGITGHAMRGLAWATHELGYTVTGLDEPATDPGASWVTEHGLKWTRDFKPEYLEGVTAIIVTGAHVSDDAPVIVEAREREIPIKSYAQLVGELTTGAQVIAVGGTHGKTTTTSLITWLLDAAGRHPDYLVGIRPFNFDTNVRLTGAKIAVVEGDEYRASPLEQKSKLQYLHPDTLVLTNVEMDHPDFFADIDAVKTRFREIITALPKTGRLIVCNESHNALEVAKAAPCDVITYSLHDGGDYQARDIAYLPAGIEFDVEAYGQNLGRVAVPLYGRHNVLNSLAATCAVLKSGLSLTDVISGAEGFKGAYRRFNLLTDPDASITVIDDYAHHPTEVAATLAAAKLHFEGRRIVAVFRPHTYSRTAALLPEYEQAFTSADEVFITDIEGAREAHLAHTVSGRDVADRAGANAHYSPSREALLHDLSANCKTGDVVVCMTVSGYEDVAGELAKQLNESA
ncbi:MAG TPA: UDP-N-acetylmuramate--L-alanine ligase [Candidatus Saccharimonadia bacterium]